ncbi:hypothetical protein PAAG_12426 [Paracoccidioides lutzii Pb01]|uniref:Uncharacterized protein n=1 Tax=Paracoccidioides lutzii (strain ATCC MYA-826 / Pb01) TaxID=502779 RepID=A0A0A2V041_PARBA|nr:hypothetical protein PAAG_12426 [Paracoccidioides lutzii Pb01]KGQ00883.1 hypothetical protein PAAG_12426 [Paracoccidioides lutzii Pb01]
MLAGPSDFMAMAKAHNIAGCSGIPKDSQNAATQYVALAVHPKHDITKEGIPNQERVTIKGEMVLEGISKPPANTDVGAAMAEDPHEKLVCIGSESANLGELKVDKGFRSSLPRPCLTPDQSTLLVDLVRKGQPISGPGSPLHTRISDSGNILALEASFLDNDRTNNVAMENTFDLLIDRLRKELDHVNQIIEDGSKPVESTGIGIYLLGRRQELEKEMAEVIEIGPRRKHLKEYGSILACPRDGDGAGSADASRGSKTGNSPLS